MSGHRLAKVWLQGEWRILVVTNMRDDETGHRAFELRSCGCRAGAAIAVRPERRSRKEDGGRPVLPGQRKYILRPHRYGTDVPGGAESYEQALREPHARPMLFAGRACPALYVSSPKAARLMMPSPEQGEGRETRPPSDMFSSGSGTRSALGRVPLTQPLAPPLVGGRASAVAYRVLVQAPVASRPHDPIFTSLSSS
jgi:hypothetical protein